MNPINEARNAISRLDLCFSNRFFLFFCCLGAIMVSFGLVAGAALAGVYNWASGVYSYNRDAWMTDIQVRLLCKTPEVIVSQLGKQYRLRKWNNSAFSTKETFSKYHEHVTHLTLLLVYLHYTPNKEIHQVEQAHVYQEDNLRIQMQGMQREEVRDLVNSETRQSFCWWATMNHVVRVTREKTRLCFDYFFRFHFGNLSFLGT